MPKTGDLKPIILIYSKNIASISEAKIGSLIHWSGNVYNFDSGGRDELALVIKFPIKGHFDKNISEVKLRGKPDDQNW